MKPKRRFPLSKKESKKFIERIKKQYKLFKFKYINTKNIEIAEYEKFVIYISSKFPILFEYKDNNILFPTLLFLIKKDFEWLPKVYVDRGATKAVSRGATLMVPGIRKVDEFGKDSVVVVVDQESNIPVAVGLSLISSEEILEHLNTDRRGKAVRIIHRPGDKVWKAVEYLLK